MFNGGKNLPVSIHDILEKKKKKSWENEFIMYYNKIKIEPIAAHI